MNSKKGGGGGISGYELLLDVYMYALAIIISVAWIYIAQIPVTSLVKFMSMSQKKISDPNVFA
jgi:hypothetical protein